MPARLPRLPSPGRQAERLIALGVHELAGLPADELRSAAALAAARVGDDDALLVLAPDLAPGSALAPLLRHDDRPGFVVADMTDVDDFTPVEPAAPPEGPVYLAEGLDRGDHLANLSPDEALPLIVAAGRTPLTLGEGIHWLLQQPEALERKHCFMTLGSRRRRKGDGLDARVPAIWLSNGTGRDGRHNRNAPKVGWCWAGNRHTWLGFASAATRTGVTAWRSRA